MSPSEDEDRRRAERARQVGLFRYGLVQDLIDTKLTTRQRGKLARELAAKEHTDPFGRQVRVARGTLDRRAATTTRAGFPRWCRPIGRSPRGRRWRCWTWRPR
ncbi:hypothetical protein [Streptomyces sp. NPDC054952]